MTIPTDTTHYSTDALERFKFRCQMFEKDLQLRCEEAFADQRPGVGDRQISRQLVDKSYNKLLGCSKLEGEVALGVTVAVGAATGLLALYSVAEPERVQFGTPISWLVLGMGFALIGHGAWERRSQ